MAITGHKSLAEVERYTRDAEQEVGAEAAIEVGAEAAIARLEEHRVAKASKPKVGKFGSGKNYIVKSIT
jgi:hypothetical protein